MISVASKAVGKIQHRRSRWKRYGLLALVVSVCLYNTLQTRAKSLNSVAYYDERMVPKDESNRRQKKASTSNKNGLHQIRTDSVNNATLGDDDDAPIFIFHVGPTKTGTTTIQAALDILDKQGILAKDNFVNIPRNIIPLIEPCIKRLSFKRCFKSCQNQVKASDLCLHYRNVDEMFSKALENRQNVVYSYEGGISFEMKPAFQELLKGFDVKPIVTYRRYYQWLPSAYNSRYKPDKTRVKRKQLNRWPGAEGGETIPTLENLLLDNIIESDRIVNLKDNSLRRFENISAVYENVAVINMHDKSKPGILHDILCEVMQALNSCKELTNDDRLSKLKGNPSSDNLRHDKIAIAAYNRGFVENKNMTRSEVRKAIKLREDDLGYTSLSDYPVKCLSRSQTSNLLETSLLYEQQMLPEFFATSAGEDVLRADFATARTNLSFCGVDAEKVVDDEAWRFFFQDLEKS